LVLPNSVTKWRSRRDSNPCFNLERAACKSAWGPDPDRRAKLLIHQTTEGSNLDAYLQDGLVLSFEIAPISADAAANKVS
jgi:hypothetical protein